MNEEAAKALRAPFPPEAIGKLPRVTDKQGEKKRCNECGGWLPRHIHLDYVGHAAVTDRLLQVDPEWCWEPVAFDDNGLPAIDRTGTEPALWIKLTICGTTRYGVGIASGVELQKQLISDAIRNAAMRFGVALDLWSKEDLHAQDADGGEAKAFESPQPEATGESRNAGHGTPSALVDIDNMKTRELNEALTARNLETGGTVKEMRARLREYEAAQAAAEFVGASEANAVTADRVSEGSSDADGVGGEPGPDTDQPGSAPLAPASPPPSIPDDLDSFSEEPF